MQTYSSFGAVNTTPPVTNNQFNAAATGYNPGQNPGDITVVQLFYQWPIYVSLMNADLPNLNGGYRLLSAAAVFRVEPYK